MMGYNLVERWVFQPLIMISDKINSPSLINRIRRSFWKYYYSLLAITELVSFQEYDVTARLHSSSGLVYSRLTIDEMLWTVQWILFMSINKAWYQKDKLQWHWYAHTTMWITSSADVFHYTILIRHSDNIALFEWYQCSDDSLQIGGISFGLYLPNTELKNMEWN